MKVRRLLFCIVMSVALVVTFIPMTSIVANVHAGSWWKDIIDTAVDINVGDEKEVTISDDEQKPEGLFKFRAPEEGTYIFYSSHEGSMADPVGSVNSEGAIWVTEDDAAFPENRDFYIYFYAYDTIDYYLYAYGHSDSTNFTIGLKKSDVESISFEPAPLHYSSGICTLDFEEWEEPLEFEAGDKITVTKTDSSSKTYVYKKNMIITYDGDDVYDDRFVNVDNEKEVLTGYKEIKPGSYPYPDEVWSAPLSENAPGSIKKVPFTIYATGIATGASINVKFVTHHGGLKKQSAVPASCTKAGNVAYWSCMSCGKKFSNNDRDNLKELSGNSWMVPATGHKWTTVTKSPAGLLQNGTSCQKCSSCGAEQNPAVIPGWSAPYAKSVKVAKGKGSLTVKWKKQSKKNLKKFDGYEVRYSTGDDVNSAKAVTVGKKKKSKKITKLAKKTTYNVWVSSYKYVDGVKDYSGWSKKTVKTK